MIRVTDACALIAYLRGEPGDIVVEGYLLDPNTTCYAHAINICEVYYAFIRTDGVSVARSAIRDLQADGVIIRKDLNRAFWRDVGELKANGSISLADCCCLALSRKLGGTVLTSDHHEFDPLV